MNNTSKITLGVIALAVIALVGFWLVGGQSANLQGAGVTRYPNSGITARFFNLSTSTPQSAGTDGQLTVTGSASISGNLTLSGNETVLGASIDNVLLTNSLVMSNATQTIYTTTSTQTTAEFCVRQQFLVLNTTGTITVAPPPIAQINAATSSCASTVAGGIQQNVWLNESTNSVIFASTTGFQFMYANISATTTGGWPVITSFTSSTFILASSSASGPGTGISFYGIRDTSSTYKVLITPYR